MFVTRHLLFSSRIAKAILTPIYTQLAAGIIFLPAVSSISHYFSKRRGLALGVVMTGNAMGGIIWPVLLNKLFKEVGFRRGVQACEFISLNASPGPRHGSSLIPCLGSGPEAAYLAIALLMIACLTVSPRLPPRARGRIFDFTVFKDPEYTIFVCGATLVMT